LVTCKDKMAISLAEARYTEHLAALNDEDE
jgi:hypothetical protein